MARPKKTNGDLIAAMATLEERVSNLVDEFQNERDGAAQHRRDLRDVIGALSGSVRELTSTVSELKPLVYDYRERRDKARGAAALAKLLHGLGYAIAGGIGALTHKIWP